MVVEKTFQGVQMHGNYFGAPTVMQFNDITDATVPADRIAIAITCVLRSIEAGRLRADARLGLSPSSFSAMRARYFPEQATHPEDGMGGNPIVIEELEDLVALLLAHRTHAGMEIEWLAHALACGCMGDEHLYQDMGLPSRQALSDLLRDNFTALFDKNTGNMKWKKFFYKQLCDQAEVRACRAPSCQVCPDYWNCFSPDEPVASPLNLTLQE